jgi:predicted metalloprotease with PDZ domain
MKSAFIATLFSILSYLSYTMPVQYTLSFPNPQDHYVFVEMKIAHKDQTELKLFMPVWTPGSYMLREFSRHVDLFTAEDLSGKQLSWQKVNKNNWKIQAKGTDTIVVRYRVYANEWTVRTSHVDADHAMLNGASVMMGVEGLTSEEHKVTIRPHADWKVISTSLSATKESQWVRTAKNYDEIVDSPIELGNHTVYDFIVAGVPHQLALVGPSGAVIEKLLTDLQAVVQEEVDLFKTEHPCDRYLFILHNTDQVRGGLEHMHSSLNMVPRWNYNQRDKYLQIISLLAHEYFHLWNVKRIRPESLGPFDYQQENYTRQLWLAEGVTSYYDDYFVYLAGVSSRQEYLHQVAENINAVINQPGDQVQSLAESSFDTWIKYYRQHENSHNNQVNYYTKGATVSTALNMLILDATDGRKSLDDVMRTLYAYYLARPDKGLSEAEVLTVFEKTAGKPLKDFFDRHIYGTEPVDYEEYFSLLGLKLEDQTDKKSVHIGWTVAAKEGKWIVSKVDAGYAAHNAGITAEDEIISLNGYRMNTGWEKFLIGKVPGDKIEVILSRSGLIKKIDITLTADSRVKYIITEDSQATPRQLMLRNAWLKQ